MTSTERNVFEGKCFMTLVKQILYKQSACFSKNTAKYFETYEREFLHLKMKKKNFKFITKVVLEYILLLIVQ